jgi:protein ImuB
MTKLEIEAMETVNPLARSMEMEASARKVFLECAAQFSPRIEEVSYGTACAFVLDIAGTERLFGPSQKLAERLRSAMQAVGIKAAIAVSANFEVARMKSAAVRGGIAVIPKGKEPAALKPLPVSALALAPEYNQTLATWGIRTLGELAALPVNELVARMGPAAQHWHSLTSGVAEHTFQPIEPAFVLEEFCEFETPVEQLDSLLFMGSRMIDCLTRRAASRALLVGSLTVHMKLEDGTVHERKIRPALPTGDRKFLLKLLQLEISAHPPQAAVVAITLTAEAGQSSQVQLGLFTPQTPEPSRLDVTLARLKALAGDESVGSAVLDDSNRAGSFHMIDFSVTNESANWSAQAAESEITRRMALRRVHPPATVRVTMRTNQLVAFRTGENRFEVNASYGPWRNNGNWWSADAWDTEEWDVLATRSNGASVACLLTSNPARTVWRLEAYYD